MGGEVLQLLLRHVAVEVERLHVAQLHHRLDVLREEGVAEARLGKTLQGVVVEASRSHENEDARRGRELVAARFGRFEVLDLSQTEVSQLEMRGVEESYENKGGVAELGENCGVQIQVRYIAKNRLEQVHRELQRLRRSVDSCGIQVVLQ